MFGFCLAVKWFQYLKELKPILTNGIKRLSSFTAVFPSAKHPWRLEADFVLESKCLDGTEPLFIILGTGYFQNSHLQKTEKLEKKTLGLQKIILIFTNFQISSNFRTFALKGLTSHSY